MYIIHIYTTRDIEINMCKYLPIYTYT